MQRRSSPRKPNSMGDAAKAVFEPPPGWLRCVVADKELRRAGFPGAVRTGLWKMPGRRLQLKSGHKRRKYWCVKREDFERLVLEAKARAVEEALDREVVHVRRTMRCS